MFYQRQLPSEFTCHNCWTSCVPPTRQVNRSKSTTTIPSITQCRDTQLPQDNSGSAYLIISLKTPGTSQGQHIGSTKHLSKRLNQHDTNWGSRQTASSLLRPWALIAYVAGFDCDYSKMRAFENEWISKKNTMLANPNMSLTVQSTITIAKDLLRDWQASYPDLTLRLVECGSVQHLQDMRAAGTARS